MPGTTKCPVVAGWRERLTNKTLVAGATGAVVGPVVALARGFPLVRYSVQTALGFTALGALFAGTQETCRLVRCHDSPVNAAIAGAVIGQLVHRANGRPVLHGAIAYGALAAAAQAAADAWRPGESLREFLERADLLDPPPPEVLVRRAALKAQREQAALRQAEEEGDGWLSRVGEAIGVRRMSAQEWEEYLEAEREDQRQRIRKAMEGRASDGKA